MTIVRGTCVTLQRQAVLIEGPSGAGKSDLALRLIGRGWKLVADDYTEIAARRGKLFAGAPQAIAGLIEVRGLGIRRLKIVRDVRLSLVVRLVPRGRVPRLPKAARRTIEGVAVPLVRLHAFDASTPLKIELALKGA